MNCVEESLRNCRDYLANAPHIRRGFETLEGSPEKGFMYELERDGCRIPMELLVEENWHVITLFAHVGVLIGADKYDRLAKYCQMHSHPDEPGMLVVYPVFRNVVYRLSIVVKERPLTAATLEWMNNCAYEKILECRDDLLALVQDDIPVRKPPEERDSGPERQSPAFPSDNLQETKKRLSEELLEGEEVTFCKNLNEDDPVLFLGSRLTENGELLEKISVNDSGCLIVALRAECLISREQIARAVRLCNRESAEQKLAGIHAYCEDGYLWFSAPVSLWDGPVGRASVEPIETLGSVVILHVLEDLGILERDEEESDEPEADDRGMREPGPGSHDFFDFLDDDELMNGFLPDDIDLGEADPLADLVPEIERYNKVPGRNPRGPGARGGFGGDEPDMDDQKIDEDESGDRSDEEEEEAPPDYDEDRDLPSFEEEEVPPLFTGDSEAPDAVEEEKEPVPEADGDESA